MKLTKWMMLFVATVFLFAAPYSFAQGNSQGKGHGKNHQKHDDDQGQDYYQGHDGQALWGWYDQHENNLPPGLAKKDRLPPGLEKQLVRRGTLPPGLQKKIKPCPRELVQQLPPPPPDCVNVLIGGHIVLLNQKTNVVVDVFHFEIHL